MRRFLALFLALLIGAWAYPSGYAQASFLLNRLNGFNVRIGTEAPGVVDITYADFDDAPTGSTTLTFSGVGLGDAAADRVSIVGFVWVNIGGGTVDAVTVGGLSAAPQVQANRSTALYRAEFWTVNTSSLGTSADIVVTISDSANYTAVATWRMTGGSATATDTAVDEDGSNPQTAGVDFDVLANGGVVGLSLTNVTGRSYTWTGATEDFDTNANNTISGASENYAAAQENLAFEALQNIASTTVVSCFAAFGPS